MENHTAKSCLLHSLLDGQDTDGALVQKVVCKFQHIQAKRLALRLLATNLTVKIIQQRISKTAGALNTPQQGKRRQTLFSINILATPFKTNVIVSAFWKTNATT